MGHGPWTNETSLWQRYLELLEKNNITVKKLPAENKSELVYDSSLPVGVVADAYVVSDDIGMLWKSMLLTTQRMIPLHLHI